MVLKLQLKIFILLSYFKWSISLSVAPHGFHDAVCGHGDIPPSPYEDPARRVFLKVASTSLFGFVPSRANAAAPITKGESENVGAQVFRFLRPKPPRVLRTKLNLDFAVLLMRSSYNVLDELDCVPMDQFQRDFFIIRQAEYEPYIKEIGPGVVQQGDLTDPYYFDFISFAQYLAINREIANNPLVVFEEQQPIKDDRPEEIEGDKHILQRFQTVVVRRDSSISNEMLAPLHSQKVGSAVLARFDEVFGETPSSLPKIPNGSRPDADVVLASFSQLVKLFLVNGFAWDGSVDLISSPPFKASATGAEFCLKLEAPATLWGGQCLGLQRCQLSNDYLMKAATELAKRLGYRIASSSVKFDGSKELNYLTLA